ncbi:MAG: thymidine kinase [Malacoplasma sp.]|nr:thymidine kinase [Malacoplasma sp.]
MKNNAFGKQKGWIELICGPMFAGKSEELLRKLKRLDYAEVKYQVFKPKIDTRTKNKVESRDGRVMDSKEFSNPYEIFNMILLLDEIPEVIAIDEAQFADESIVDVCQELADFGFIVYVSALDKNFKNEPFMVTAKMACCAEYVEKLSAICTECGAPGTITQRMVNDKPSNYNDPVVQIGNYESYTVKCRHHHKVIGKPASNEVKNFRSDFKAKKNKHS